mgnify:CR=1 FL=1
MGLKGEMAMANTVLEQVGFIIGDWIPKEASIAVAAENQYIYYKAGIHDLSIKEGQPVSSGTIAARVAKEGSKVEMYVEEAVLGSAYYGVGYPITIDNRDAVLVITLPPDYVVGRKKPLAFLTCKQEDCWRPIPVEKVSHIESSQKKTWFYADEEPYCSSHTLKNLKEQLPDYFLTVHRSFIVNVHYIEEIAKDVTSNYVLTLRDGSTIPVSQNHTAEVRSRLGF